VGPSAVRVRSGYSRTSSILTQIIVLDGPLVAYCGSLYFFSALHDVCERVFLMSLDAQQRYSHCFLDGLHHPIISYRQNASRSNFLGLEFFPLFLGFPIGSFFVFFFFRLISGEAGFNSHLVYGQFVQDNLAISTVGFIGRVWHARRRLFTTPQPFYHPCAYNLTMCSGLILTTVAPTSAPITLVYIFIFMHLLPVFRQSISSTLPDDPTGHTPQFRAF
jgi:hypothetical protein